MRTAFGVLMIISFLGIAVMDIQEKRWNLAAAGVLLAAVNYLIFFGGKQ